MKNGTCPMCQSNEVYMTEDESTLKSDGEGGLNFSVLVDKEMGFYHFDTYVCLTCGYTAIFAHPTGDLPGKMSGFTILKNPELTFLKKAKEWKKVA